MLTPWVGVAFTGISLRLRSIRQRLRAAKIGEQVADLLVAERIEKSQLFGGVYE